MNPADHPDAPTGMDPALLRLLQRSACINELSFGVAHKLNNALAGTISNLELIDLEEQLPATTRELCKSSSQAAWKAAGLTRGFGDFLIRDNSAPGPLHADEILAQVVQFLRSYSDALVELIHLPSPQPAITRTSPSVLADTLIAVILLGQRLLGSGTIQLSTATESGGPVIRATLQPHSGAAGLRQKEQEESWKVASQKRLDWVVRSLAASAGGSFSTLEQEGRTAELRLHLPAAS